MKYFPEEGLAAFIEQEMQPTMQDADLENINIGDAEIGSYRTSTSAMLR
jgi:hypothetical protein